MWKPRKVKLYLDTSVTHTKIVLPNRVKNENIFGVAAVKPFSRDKSIRPIYFALVYNQGILLSRFFIGRFSVCHSCQLVQKSILSKSSRRFQLFLSYIVRKNFYCLVD